MWLNGRRSCEGKRGMFKIVSMRRDVGAPKEARGVQRSSSKASLWTFPPSYSLEARERKRSEKRMCELPLLWEQSGMSNNAFLSLWPKALPPLAPPSPSHPPTTTKRKLQSLSIQSLNFTHLFPVLSFLTGSPPDTTTSTNTLLLPLEKRKSIYFHNRLGCLNNSLSNWS